MHSDRNLFCTEFNYKQFIYIALYFTDCAKTGILHRGFSPVNKKRLINLWL